MYGLRTERTTSLARQLRLQRRSRSCVVWPILIHWPLAASERAAHSIDEPPVFSMCAKRMGRAEALQCSQQRSPHQCSAQNAAVDGLDMTPGWASHDTAATITTSATRSKLPVVDIECCVDPCMEALSRGPLPVVCVCSKGKHERKRRRWHNPQSLNSDWQTELTPLPTSHSTLGIFSSVK